MPSFGDPLAAARRVAEEVLAPAAQETDQAALVPRGSLDALAAAGLFGLAGPGAGGREGGPAPAPIMRDVQEVLAGACGATYFVWAQHHSPVRMLASSANTTLGRRWLGRLCGGEALAGLAFAYLRRPGPPAVTAERAPGGGWRAGGTAPFVTSWGLADVFLVVAVAPERHLVWFLLEGAPTAAVRPSPPLALAVLQATATVSLTLDDLLVPDADVVRVEPLAAWEARDRLATPQPSSAALGVADRCCRLLLDLDRAPATAAARALGHELQRCRRHSYALADQLAGAPTSLPVDAADADAGPDPGLPGGLQPGEAHLARMTQARAWGLDLAQRASLALVAATGGKGMLRSHPAQRLAREAAFYAVQAQTGAIREATLSRLARP